MSLEDSSRRRQFLFLAAFAVLALTLALRAPWLGRLGLHGDEDISTLAFRGILATGIPTLPSGHVYWRAPLYSYLAAPLAAPGIDWLPRVLSVLLSCGTALLLLRLGRRWVGDGAALLATLFFALSLAEIHNAREARFYALFQALALVLIYALDRFARTGATRWALAALGAGLGAMASHELGVTLAVLFVVPVLRPLGRRAQAVALGVMAGFTVLSLMQRRLVGASMTGGGTTIAQASGRVEPGPLSELLAAGGAMTGGSGVLLLLIVAVVGFLGWRAAHGKAVLDRLIAAVGFGAVALFSGMHQFGAAVGGLVVLILVSPDLLHERRGRASLGFLGAGLALAGAAWLASDLAQGTSFRHAVRDLGGGPLVIGISLLRPPAVAVPALLGSAVVLASALRRRPWDGPRFLLLCIALLTVVRGLLAPKIVDRYMTDVWPLWELLAGWAIVEGIRLASTRLSTARAAILGWVTAGAVAAGVLLLPGTAPAETLHYLRRQPGAMARGVFPPMVPDLRGAARFVKEHAAPTDRVAATDWLTTYCYTGKVDLWLRSDKWEQQAVELGGVARDIYLGARVVPALADLEALRDEGPLWVIAGGLELYDDGDDKLEAPLREFLRRQPAAWEARDGFTRVLRLEPRALAPAARR